MCYLQNLIYILSRYVSNFWCFSNKNSIFRRIQMAKIEKETHLEEAERARSQMAADRMATSDKLFVFSFDLEKL